VKYIVIRDANIEGHCISTHFCKNGSGKEMFVIGGENIAYRFSSTMEAGKLIDKLVSEKGWLRENMKILETSTDATMEMPL
jgi:hypothetical protein